MNEFVTFRRSYQKYTILVEISKTRHYLNGFTHNKGTNNFYQLAFFTQ